MEAEKFKASHFDNIDELIKTCKLWINDDDYEAYYRFFDMGAMEELIKEITRIKEESISRAVVEEKIKEIDYSYKNIEKNYTEEQLDNYDVSEEDYIEMEKREFAEMFLQELLNKGE